MISTGSFAHQKSQKSLASCALWPVDLKLTHLDWNPEATLIHFQGQYLTICELDYNMLQGEIQNVPKTKASVNIGEFCLVEDLSSARWYRGRVQNRREDLFDVFLIDHGNVLSVGITHLSSCSNDLFQLPPKLVCGFLANVLLFRVNSVLAGYFSSLIGRNIKGQALLTHKVLLLEAPDINEEIVTHGFGRYVDTDTFLLLVEMLTGVPLKQNIEPVPDLLIEKPRGPEFCFKSSCLQGYDNILALCGPRLKCGTRVKVRVTAAVSPKLFYCQMTSAVTDLQEMSKKLTTVCEYKNKVRNQKQKNLGLLCSVKAKDGKWYRGYMQFLPVNSQVKVLFIDFGFFESVKVENVQRLPADFYSVPIMAFPCSLSLHDRDEAAKTQQLSFLKAGLLGQVLDVDISSFDEDQQLYTVTIFGAEEKNGKELEAVQNHPKKLVGSVTETETKSPQVAYLGHKTVIGPEEEQQVESLFVGYVEYVQNPNHFWIRTQKRNNEFEEMMTQISNHFRQIKLEEETVVKLEVGTMCCAIYEEDMHFYRAVVTNILDYGAEVLFVDFGNTEKVPRMMIKQIPEVFAKKSAFALCCTLANVCPLDEVWTSTTSDFFRKAVLDKALLVHVVQKWKTKYVVELFEMGKDNKLSISEHLIYSKHAEKWNVPTKSVVKHTKRISEKSRPPRYASQVINRKKEESVKEENVCKSEMEKVQVSDFKALHIKPGYAMAVRCSYINSLSDFWCQPLDKVSALEEMMRNIQEYYSTRTVPLQSRESCCIAKSSVDGLWYRAFITDKQRGHARVLLIDYGFTVQTCEENLQGILAEYLGMEAQAFRCSLYNLTETADLKNCSNSKTQNVIKDFVHARTGGLRCEVILQLNVKSKVLCNIVDLYDTQTRESLTKVLIQKGLAREESILTKLQSGDFPESYVYCSYDLVPGKEETVYVTYVSSQWEVYCHLDKNTDIIKELEEKISKESVKMTQSNTRAVVRKLCLAKYFDGKWYRGLAFPVQSPLHLRVFFVDYGNSSISEKSQVMFIPRDSVDLLFTPMQAVQCSLASVSKKDLYADAKKCLEDAVLNKPLRAAIVGKNEDGSFDVELFDGDVNINKKVNELILSLLPKPKTVVCVKTSIPTLKHINSSANPRVQSKGTSWRSSTPNPHRATQGWISPQRRKENTIQTNSHRRVHNKTTQLKQQNQGKTRSCVSTAPQNRCQWNHLTKFKGPIISENLQHNKEADLPQLSCLPDRKLDAGLRAKCFASHVESVSSFFLQLSEDEPVLLKMVEDLNSDDFRKSLKATTSLRIKDLVLAEYEEDGGLYRSVVKEYQGSSCLIVEFIDYGNSAVVEKQKIYFLPKDYLSQPRLSIACSLLNTDAHEKGSSFTDALMEKPLMVEFVFEHEDRWNVNVDILDSDDVLPVAVEGVKSCPDNETEEEHPASFTQTEEKLKPSDEPGSYQGVEPFKPDKNILLQLPPVASSATLKVKTRRRRRKIQMRKKASLKNSRRTSKSLTQTTREPAGTFSPKAIGPKDSEVGTVLSVQTDGKFYIRPAKNRDQFAALQRCIDDTLPMCETVAEEDVKPGLKCLAEVGNKWHRALVQQAGSGRCQVLLVDDGVIVETSFSALRRQLSSMEGIPNLALLCKTAFSEGEYAQKLLEQILAPMIGKEVKVVFVQYSDAEMLWLVEIVMTGLFPIYQTAALPQQDPTKTEHEATETEPNMEPERPQELIFASIDREKSYFGFATAVVSPSEFSIVPEDLLHVLKKVSVISNQLEQPMSPIPETLLLPGTCCLFKLDSEKKWCRAQIVSIDTGLVLHLVDYGYCERLPYKDVSKLRRLPEELLNLPRVMYPCILRGVKAVDGQWTDGAAVLFQQCLHQKHLQIFFREFVSNTHWKVDILADGVHVAKNLVDAGHASYLDVMLELRFQEQSPMREEDLKRRILQEAEYEMLFEIVSGTRQCLLT